MSAHAPSITGRRVPWTGKRNVIPAQAASDADRQYRQRLLGLSRASVALTWKGVCTASASVTSWWNDSTDWCHRCGTGEPTLWLWACAYRRRRWHAAAGRKSSNSRWPTSVYGYCTCMSFWEQVYSVCGNFSDLSSPGVAVWSLKMKKLVT